MPGTQQALSICMGFRKGKKMGKGGAAPLSQLILLRPARVCYSGLVVGTAALQPARAKPIPRCLDLCLE